jgi:hypothetical protein
VAILARGAEPVETRRGLPGDPGDTHSRYIEAAIGGFAFGRDAGLRIDHLLLSPSFIWSAYAVRGEIAEADNPSEIGSAHAFAHGKRSKGDPVALDEDRVEPICPDKQLINRAFGFTTANGSVPLISMLISIASVSVP